MQKYACSFKGMTRKYLGPHFKIYQHNKRTDASNCVYVLLQNLLFYADKSILRALIWLVWSMQALYIQLDTYLACVEWSAIFGGPLRFQKLPIRSSIQTVCLQKIKVQRMISLIQNASIHN